MNQNQIQIHIPVGFLRNVRKPGPDARNQNVTYFQVATIAGGDLNLSTETYKFDQIAQIADAQMPLAISLAVTFSIYDGKQTCKVLEMECAQFGVQAAPVASKKAS